MSRATIYNLAELLVFIETKDRKEGITPQRIFFLINELFNKKCKYSYLEYGMKYNENLILVGNAYKFSEEVELPKLLNKKLLRGGKKILYRDYIQAYKNLSGETKNLFRLINEGDFDEIKNHVRIIGYNTKEKSLFTPFTKALISGNSQIIEYFLDEGVINENEPFNFTDIISIISESTKGLISKLIQVFPPKKLHFQKISSFLLKCFEKGFFDLALLFLERYEKYINFKKSRSVETWRIIPSILQTSSERKYEIATFILNLGYNINMSQYHYKTPFIEMVRHSLMMRRDFTEELDFLIKFGVDINYKDKDGHTLLSWLGVGSSFDDKMMNYLLDRGLDILLPCGEGNKRLIYYLSRRFGGNRRGVQGYKRGYNNWNYNPDELYKNIKTFIKFGADCSFLLGEKGKESEEESDRSDIDYSQEEEKSDKEEEECEGLISLIPDKYKSEMKEIFEEYGSFQFKPAIKV